MQRCGPLRDTLFEFLIESRDFGLRSLQRGGFDNVPTARSPCDGKLVRAHRIQDFKRSALSKRIRAQHGEVLVADKPVDTLFEFTKMCPIFVGEPARIPGHPHTGIAFARCASEFLTHSGCYSFIVKGAALEKQVVRSYNFYTGLRQILIKIGHYLL